MVQQYQVGHTNAISACLQDLPFFDSKSPLELEFLRPKQLRNEPVISICSLIDKYKHEATPRPKLSFYTVPLFCSGCWTYCEIRANLTQSRKFCQSVMVVTGFLQCRNRYPREFPQCSGWRWRLQRNLEALRLEYEYNEARRDARPHLELATSDRSQLNTIHR